MFRMIKYLKPYVFVLIIIFVLLFGQAICDLYLPNLMSNIVDVGIQNNGIEDAAPNAISDKGFSLMYSFMDNSQKELVSNNYLRISKEGTSSDHGTYLKRYPLLKTEDIYVLNPEHEAGIDQLNGCFEKSAMTLIAFIKSSGDEGELTSTLQNLKGIDISKAYSMIPTLNSLPNSSFDEARQRAGQVEQRQLSQTGVIFARHFYKELGTDMGWMQGSYIAKIGMYMLAITFLGIIATVIVDFISARMSSGLSRTMRRDIFKKVESFSSQEFDEFSTASLITRTTNDITQVQSFLIMGVRMVCFAPLMGIGGIVMAVQKSSSMSWIIVLGVVILVGLITGSMLIALPKFKILQKLVDKLNLVVRENLSGMLVIRSFGTQKFEEDRFDGVNKDLTNISFFVNRIMIVMMPVMMFMLNAISLLIVWVASHEIAKSTMQIGDMIAFMQYAMQIIMSFLMVSIMFISIPRASISIARVSEVLNKEPRVLDPENPKAFEGNIRGKIEFRNVGFKYGQAEDYVIKGISFTANPGETTAFIGSTGSGKSTLVNLIPRFYDVTDGEILIDGINIKDVNQYELRKNIGYVSQKGVLFSGTIESNIRYGDSDATQEEVELAAKISQSADFIASKEKGFDDNISQGGMNISGGQKQRLSIARALIKKAPIYIFDDSFSSLDLKTDAALRKSLKENLGKSTVLIVTQRIGTIMNADQIIVIDQGKIVGKGTHKELMKNCETYKEIAISQFAEEEIG